MSRFKTREALFNYSQTTAMRNTTEWDDWVMSLTIPAEDFNKPLYHISHSGKLTGPWKALTSFAGSNPVPDIILNEALPPRISTSTTFEGCYFGTFGGISNMWMTPHKESIVMYFYQFDYSGCRLLLPETLTKEWLVHDAHETKEVCIFGEPVAKLYSKITLKNTEDAPDSECSFYHPFNDARYPKRFMATPMIQL